MKIYKVTITLDKTIKIEARSKAWVREVIKNTIEDGLLDKDIKIKIKEK